MKKEWYSFANRLTLPAGDPGLKCAELDELTKKQYERSILDAIRQEKQETRSNSRFPVSSGRRGVAAAAVCLVLLGPVMVFHEEAHAAVTHIAYSLRDALGLKSDISQYTEIIDTPISDKGYVVTLQEAAAAPQKLVISYTVQREDGQPVPDTFSLDGALSVNGKAIHSGASGSAGFLDPENKILGINMSYDVSDIDLSDENTYEISFSAFNSSTAEDDIGGHWVFRFKADGTELFANTRIMELQNEFVLPDGRVVTLVTFSDNPLEQQLSYTISDTKGNDILLKLTATDEQGRTAVFSVSRSSGSEGCMINETLIKDGRIPADAKTVTATLYARELPKESGKEPDDYAQIGEPVTWDLSALVPYPDRN